VTLIRNLVALGTGILFGLGLAVSGMANPKKVLGFLDITGDWDPSLALVMAAALAVAFLGFRSSYGRGRPLLAETFGAPTPGIQAPLDGRLIAGAILFGAGWGLVGFCPGPAIASLAFGRIESVVFVIAMVAGVALHNLMPRPMETVPKR
jgi:uncharacterized membrane protein YedE/YeeE